MKGISLTAVELEMCSPLCTAYPLPPASFQHYIPGRGMAFLVLLGRSKEQRMLRWA